MTTSNTRLNAVLRAWVTEWAHEHGIELRRVPRANSLAQEFSPTQRRGNLQGPENWTIRVVAQGHRLDIATPVRQVEIDRQDNADRYGVAILEVKAPRGSEGEFHDPYVVMPLTSWARIVHDLQGSHDPLDSD